MDDNEAILSCQQGNNESFGVLVRRYERELMGHALTLLGNREDALDAVQETFLRAFKAINQFQVGKRFYPWIYGILRNFCVDKFRKVKEEPLQEKVWNPAELYSGLAESDEKIKQLWSALGKLEREDREIIVLKHLENRSYEDIAQILQILRGTVMSRLYRAREKLKKIVYSENNLKIINRKNQNE